ncbi:glyoxalase [Microbacterium sulfonylureivorans]|uniref:glyoxalase n=1 Tax=Microbacterium sulfonylureivorans TaxID=2486854 RepID=UPI000FDB0356|nr:glyoxalase [Microbacterium sulfonylureivorans]
MRTIDSVTILTDDPAASDRFHEAAFGLGSRVRSREADAEAAGFRGFTLSAIVAQPADVHALYEDALAAGATSLKPVEKSLWGVGGVVQAPDGTIWQIATSAKQDIGPAMKSIESVVLLLGVDDVVESRKSYVERGAVVAKSFGRAYAEFDMPGSPITLGLNRRKALAKVAGVAPEGSGSHRVEINAAAESFTDRDGFVWAQAVA